MKEVPPWLILHVPHDSTHIPAEVRHQFALSFEKLERELLAMTDHLTLDLFGHGVPPAQVVRAPVSRLVLDVERFEEDQFEPMALRGMGAVYTKTQDGQPLRHPLSDVQRNKLLEDWYRPHHAALTLASENALQASGLAVIVDCHSFPLQPLPYEIDQSAHRPQICIGTDAFHTPAVLVRLMVEAFESAGFVVGLDSPFSGSLVPTLYYKKDPRVLSIMVEVRRDVYLIDETGLPNAEFGQAARNIQQSLLKALENWQTLQFYKTP